MRNAYNQMLISFSASIASLYIIKLFLGSLSRRKMKSRRFQILVRQLGNSSAPERLGKSLSEINSQVIRVGELLVQHRYKERLMDLSNQLGSNSEVRLSQVIGRKVYFSIFGAFVSLILVTQGKTILILPTIMVTIIGSFIPNSYLFVTRLLKGNYGKRLGNLASTSGSSWASPERLVLAKVFSSLIVFGLSYIFLIFQSDSLAGLSYLPLSLIAGFFIPDIVLYNKVAKRRESFEETFPDAIDLLSMCVNAGLAFPAALVKVSDMQGGPVSEEFLRVRAEVQLGKDRNEALREMSDRMKVDAVKNFVNAVGQVDRFGIPISSALAEQSRELRAERKAKGREKAQKVPIKILGPVMLCFLPCVLLIVLGPAIIGILGAF